MCACVPPRLPKPSGQQLCSCKAASQLKGACGAGAAGPGHFPAQPSHTKQHGVAASVTAPGTYTLGTPSPSRSRALTRPATGVPPFHALAPVTPKPALTLAGPAVADAASAAPRRASTSEPLEAAAAAASAARVTRKRASCVFQGSQPGCDHQHQGHLINIRKGWLRMPRHRWASKTRGRAISRPAKAHMKRHTKSRPLPPTSGS